MRHIFRLFAFILLLSPVASQAQEKFSAREQQSISTPTPGLFRRSVSFSIDFSDIKSYSFPLPVGRAEQTAANELRISTSRGDAVKAMFDGVVRLARKTTQYGNAIVVRHANGLETLYANNAQNLVKVGQQVKAGQTVAIVGTNGGETYCLFAIMVDGNKINPATLLDLGSHKLRPQTVVFRKSGHRVHVSVEQPKADAKEAKDAHGSRSGKSDITSLDPDDEISILRTAYFKLDLQKIEAEHWAYPLPGSHVISPYGGKRSHGGVDIKTKPNDKILAAFDGVVTRSGPYFGYGNCIVIRHGYGFETLYSHQSRNYVKVGQKVKAGQVIGLTGRTGRATTEHLHFEIHFKGRRINPALFFDHANKRLRARVLTLGKNGSLK